MAKKHKDNKNSFAVAVSLLLNPVVMLVLQVVLFSKAFSLSPQLVVVVSAPFLVPVFLYIAVMVFVLRKVDYEFTKREQRWPVLVLGISGFLLSIWLTLMYAPALTHIYIRILVMLLIIASITFYWKISFHAIFFTMTVLLYANYFAAGFISLLGLLPLLYWSRMQLHKHTLNQLLMGSILAIIVVL